MVYRFFCLQSHYRKPLEFTFELLDNAKSAYEKLKKRTLALLPAEGNADPAVFEEYRARFLEALGNDINTSMAITVLYDVLKADTDDATKKALVESFDQVLSLDLLKAPENAEETPEDAELAAYVEEQIALRKAAKKEKNFAEADRIREELLSRGIQIRDTREGTLWEKI